MKTYEIFIVDDHPVYRKGLKALLESEKNLSVIGEASGSAAALAGIKASPPDLAIVDLSLSEGSGLQLIKSINTLDNKIKILVASMHDDTIYAERTLRLGAHGYINKEHAASKIVDAIDAILKGHIYHSNKISHTPCKSESISSKNQETDQISQLSNREIEVFTLIGQGYTSKEIADKLHLSPKTVDSHREHIKLKLGIKNNIMMIQQAVCWVLNEAH